jgi:bifunctional DNase/RNase
MMEKIKLEILGLSSSQSQSGSFALVLGEVDGDRRLPIIIGMFEAQAIAMEMEKVKPSRPMTHDLFRALGNELGFVVDEIVISDLKEGVFFAQVMVQSGKKQFSLDARPSDAIAIGLRFDAPIYTYETILSEAGVKVDEGDEGEEGEEEEEQFEDISSVEKAEPASEKTSKKSVSDLKSLSLDKLNEMLNEAIEHEDYEKAARIRDELNKRN